MLTTLLSKIASVKDCKAIFLDFNDLTYGQVNQDYVFRLWAKHMIRELAIDLTILELVLIRKECENFLAETLEKEINKIPYQDVINEIYTRLICTHSLTGVERNVFIDYFKNCNLLAEIMAQKPNVPLIKTLEDLSKKGYSIYCLSNSCKSSSILMNWLKYHKVEGVFKDVIVTSQNESGTTISSTVSKILDDLRLQPKETLFIGSFGTDLLAAAKKLDFTIVKLEKQRKTNGSALNETVLDQKKYRKIVRELYKKCNNKTAPPHSDYILFYYVYIERLYKKAKKDNVKNILFLAREGLFLKKLFDYYQSEVSINKTDDIKAHYFKASRNSLMLASFKDIALEEFEYLRRRWPNLSVNSFLKNFHFEENTTNHIVRCAGLDDDREEVIENFLDTDTFLTLKKTHEFIKAYDETRKNQKQYFEAYLDSFDINIKTEGIHLTDVGWGGTMQNRLYAFFENKVKVHGYYLGVREVNNIRESTLKYGLNFSVYPYITFFDHIFMANIELNEQLLAAGHGSTIAYTDKENGYTIEYFEENDRRVYDTYIRETQDFMFECFKELTRVFKLVCYDYDLVQYEMADYALRVGLFANKRKVAREVNIYKGFYHNVGGFSVGLAMGKNFSRKQIIELIKNFFFYPEEAFRYIVRFKPMLMRRKKYALAYLIPSSLIYLYIKIRCRRKGLKQKIRA